MGVLTYCALEAEAGKGGDDGRAKQLLPSALSERKIARASEGEIERGKVSSHC
jgi:hypothetical protein